MIHTTPDQFHHDAVSAGGTISEASPIVELLDFHPAPADVRVEVIAGLSKPQKQLPCKFFYDARGSALFDAICELPEYYPTRTESRITRDNAEAIADAIGPNALLVEYGSGSSLKTRILLDHLHDLAGYVPIDISKSHLMASAESIAGAYPGLAVKAVCADYTRPRSRCRRLIAIRCQSSPISPARRSAILSPTKPWRSCNPFAKPAALVVRS